MSIIRTTSQARGLQRASCGRCVICGKDARLLIDAQVEQFYTMQSGEVVGGHFIPRKVWNVCSKHKQFIGPIDVIRGDPKNGQFNRVTRST